MDRIIVMSQVISNIMSLRKDGYQLNEDEYLYYQSILRVVTKFNNLQESLLNIDIEKVKNANKSDDLSDSSFNFNSSSDSDSSSDSKIIEDKKDEGEAGTLQEEH